MLWSRDAEGCMVTPDGDAHHGIELAYRPARAVSVGLWHIFFQLGIGYEYNTDTYTAASPLRAVSSPTLCTRLNARAWMRQCNKKTKTHSCFLCNMAQQRCTEIGLLDIWTGKELIKEFLFICFLFVITDYRRHSRCHSGVTCTEPKNEYTTAFVVDLSSFFAA